MYTSVDPFFTASHSLSCRNSLRSSAYRLLEMNRFGRSYATIKPSEALIVRPNNEPNSSINHYEDTLWPDVAHPTPYEIFGLSKHVHISRNEFRNLKKRYHRYAKLYHPDLNNTVVSKVYKVGLRQLTPSEKIKRFNLVSEAYDILTTPSKKTLYDMTRSNWSNTVPRNAHAGMDYAADAANGFYSNSTYAYWNAGTWEDMREFNERYYGYRSDEELSLRTMLAIFFGMFLCVEGTVLLQKLQSSLIERSDVLDDEDIEEILSQTYENFGLDTDKFSRIRRFLWFRSWGLYRSKEDLDREAKQNESLMGIIGSRDAAQPEVVNTPVV